MLAPTGLVSLAPRDVRTWIDRVRAGNLDAGESAATLRLTYRLWLVGLLLKMMGSGWDVSWHFRFIRDDFAPPHNINLIGDGIVIALVLFHWYTRFGVDRLALRLMTGGIALFVISAPIDVINHRINGLDITSWSVTHFGLYTGTAIMILGAIRGWSTHAAGRAGRSLVLGGLWLFFLENVWFPNQHQEYGVEAIAAWDRGQPDAEPDLLNFAADQMNRPVDREMVVVFSLPVPAWVYPLWIITAVTLALLVARRSVGRRWTATALAAGYLAWRCVLYPFLIVGGFPPSAVPFAILAAGVAVDLVCRLPLAWPAEAAVGAVTVTAAVYLALFVQAYVLVAPPAEYWSAPAAAAVLFLAWSAVAALRWRRVPSLSPSA